MASRKPHNRRSKYGRLLRKPAVLAPAACVAGLCLFAVYAARNRPVRLAHAESSPQAVAATVVRALADSDLQTLKNLTLSREEFQSYVWPELPASNPRTNIPFDFVWNDVYFRSLNRLAKLYERYRGRKVEIVSMSSAKTKERFASHTAWPDYRFTIRIENGAEEDVPLFGTLIEMDGVYKVYSYAPYD